VGTEVARGDGPVPFLVYEQRRRRVTELLDDAARWAGRDHLVQQHRFLGGRGEQPVPGHANILSNTADISGEVKRRFLPGLKAGVSTPRF